MSPLLAIFDAPKVPLHWRRSVKC